MLRPSQLGAAALAASLGLATSSSAQSHLTMDTFGNVDGFTGPAIGLCQYPSGPQLSQATYVTGSPCAPIIAPVPGPPSLVGDIASNRVENTFWVTDGTNVVEFDHPNTAFNGFTLNIGSVLGGPITGLGYDWNTDGLWLTDGDDAVQMAPPPIGLCDIGPSILVPAFPLPLLSGATATDIAWDPITSSLWVCDDTGMVTNVTTTGALGPLGRFSPSALTTCPLGTVLQGIAVDTAGAPGALYVTDGDLIYYVDAQSGAAGPSRFYSGTSCYDTSAGGTIMGLAGTSSPIGFGSPSGGQNPFPFPFNGFPGIGANGQSVVPNPNFQLEFGGLRNGEIGALFISGATLCPGIPISNANLLIDIGIGLQTAVFQADDTGFVVVPAPLPATLKTGVTLFFQAYMVELDFITPFFGISSTRGLAVTTSVR